MGCRSAAESRVVEGCERAWTESGTITSSTGCALDKFEVLAEQGVEEGEEEEEEEAEAEEVVESTRYTKRINRTTSNRVATAGGQSSSCGPRDANRRR